MSPPLHLYCIRRPGEPGPPPGLLGVDGSEVRRVEHAGVGAWVSEGGGAPSVERLRRHDEVVRAALATATPLPVRYGGAVAGDDALRARMEEGAAQWIAALARVEGRVEMGLTLAWDEEAERAAAGADPAEADAGPPADGRAYLARLQRRARGEDRLRERAEERLRAVEAELGALEWPVARSVLPRPGIAGTLAHLVPRADVEEHRRRARALAGRVAGVRLLSSGPWAPYSFV